MSAYVTEPSRPLPGDGAGPPKEEAPRPAPRRPRLYALDGLRLVAALSVLSFHWTADSEVPEIWGGRVPADFMPEIARFTSYGWLGVQLFFIISGFVICMSCWGRKPGDFFVSRVVRLMPAYWAGVLLTTAVLVLVPTLGRAAARDGIDLRTVLSNLTMFQGPLGTKYVDGVYWTLWMELQFYLMFAVVVRMGLSYRRVTAFCGIWLVASLLVPQAGNPLLTSFVMPLEAPYFIAGVAIYLMYRFGPNLMLWGIVGFTWLISVTRAGELKKGFEAAAGHPLSWNVVVAVITLSYVLIIAVALGYFGWARWKWLTVAGALTYPLYLIHQEAGWTMIHWLRSLGARSSVALGVSLVAALVAAWLLHRLVERPLGDLLKRRLSGSIEAMRAASGPSGRRRAEPDRTP
ncbi:acyltransferase family protein [Kitasatospora sp. NPDC059463]|uniref:acyltransferase family protein n=1 Tax=Kitasatospora sp. NPDC059463 TaxID=3346842 RepID=UPI0036CE9826